MPFTPIDSYDPTLDASDVKPAKASGKVDGFVPIDQYDATGDVVAPEHEVVEEDDLGAAAMRGLKQTFAPHLLSKEDIKGDHSGMEMATEAGVSMAGDVGSTMLAGAAAGAVLGPGGAAVGAIALPVAAALYRGFAYEKARSAAEGKEFSLARGGLNAVTELNPLVAKGGRIFKMVSQAALEGGKELAYSGSKENAVFAGVLGGAFGAAFHKEGAGWAALIGQPAAKPGSATRTVGSAKYEVTEMGEMLKFYKADGVTEDTESLAYRVYNRRTQTEAADPEYFKLGDRLEKAETARHAARSQVDDFGNLVPSKNRRKAKHKGSETDDFGDEIRGEKEVIEDAEGFVKFIADIDGVSFKDHDVQTKFNHYMKNQGSKKPMELDGVTPSKYTQAEKDYAVYKMQKLAINEVEKYNSDAAKGIRGATELKDPTSGGMVDKLRDMKFQMRMVDDATGGVLNLEGSIERFVQAKNKQSVIMSTFLSRAQKLTKAARNSGLSNEELGSHLAREPGKETSFINKDHQKIAEGWTELWEDARQKLNQEGLDVDFIGTGATYSKGFDEAGEFNKVAPREDGWRRYLPMSSKRGADMHTSLRRELSRLERDAKKFGGDFFNNEESEGLRRVVGHLLDMDPDDIKSKHLVEKAMEKSLLPNGKSMHGFEAGATFQRTPNAVIPEFARDMDVGNLFVNYLNNNFKAAIYKDAFTQMGSNVQVLRSMGLEKSADYVDRYLGQISGKQSDHMAKLQHMVNKHVVSAQTAIDAIVGDDLSDKAKRGALKMKRELPRQLAFMTGQLYPNWLGWNVKAALRNYSQPLLTTAPELGWGYGSRLVGKATMETWRDFSGAKGSVAPWADKSKFDMFAEKLQPKGLAPGQHHGEIADISSKSVRTVKGLGTAMDLLDKHNSAAMWAYGLSDNVNRAITQKVAHQLAKDFAAGQKNAVNYVRKTASEGNRKALRDLVGGKTTVGPEDIEKLGDELAVQLISKTQFNYGKESMNEFGREYGRMFSMFTKWPAMIMSDTDEIFRKNKLGPASVKMLQRYMAPTMALMAMGTMVLDTKNDPKMAYLVGKNLADAAPANSLSLSAPPLIKTGLGAVETGMDFAKDMISVMGGEMEAMKALGKVGDFGLDTMLTYMPGTALVNEGMRLSKAMSGK